MVCGWVEMAGRKPTVVLVFFFLCSECSMSYNSKTTHLTGSRANGVQGETLANRDIEDNCGLIFYDYGKQRHRRLRWFVANASVCGVAVRKYAYSCPFLIRWMAYNYLVCFLFGRNKAMFSNGTWWMVSDSWTTAMAMAKQPCHHQFHPCSPKNQ